MIHIDEVRNIDYTMVVRYNGGEGQLLVIRTHGQDGSTTFSIISVGVDGDFDVITPKTRKRSDLVWIEIELGLHKWYKCTNDYSKESADRDVQRILTAMHEADEL